jgi:hypothetical protein
MPWPTKGQRTATGEMRLLWRLGNNAWEYQVGNRVGEISLDFFLVTSCENENCVI